MQIFVFVHMYMCMCVRVYLGASSASVQIKLIGITIEIVTVTEICAFVKLINAVIKWKNAPPIDPQGICLCSHHGVNTERFTSG